MNITEVLNSDPILRMFISAAFTILVGFAMAEALGAKFFSKKNDKKDQL